MEWFKKTWKFLLGVAITILGGMLLFRKDKSGEIIEKSTDNANKSIDAIIISNEEKQKKIEELEEENREDLERIRRVFESNKSQMNDRVKRKIESNLESGDAKRATSYLSRVLGIKNLDEVD